MALLVALLGLAAAGEAHGSGAFVEGVRFVQYSDESTALEEVRAGNLDAYYYRIPSDRLQGAGAREGLQVHESTGGSYDILLNPAESKEINPFSSKKARFAINYLLDRGLIVNELMGGYGVPMVSNYGPFDPEYPAVLEQIESFGIRHDPGLAREMISEAMEEMGASMRGERWYQGGEPVSLTVFIRSDDPVRRSIGEMLASGLEGMGFAVEREFGDLNKAFVLVYGSDPAELKWHAYTEGWGGRSAFVRYDQTGLAQMYAPWFSNMPGFNSPGYWNYQNEQLDEITRKIYSGEFGSAAERDALLSEASGEGVSEAVRVFLAAKIDQYAVGESVSGIINDFGAGVPTRFTPINARAPDGVLDVGVKQVYQGAWNPVRGLTDSYSTQIWGAVSDPAVFRHPYTGLAMPVRAEWEVRTAGPGGKIAMPEGAVVWNPQSGSWEDAAGGEATSAVAYSILPGNWHHGEPTGEADLMYAAYFLQEWGSGDGNLTSDPEYTPQAAQAAASVAGVRPFDGGIEVYVDYWHFDEGEIAAWAAPDGSMPWEIYAAMERVVTDGGAAFSRSAASARSTSWLSLLVPGDARKVLDVLEEFASSEYVPPALAHSVTAEQAAKRYAAAAEWIRLRDHAVISDGPFELESYSPESRTVRLSAFDDPSYPIERGRYSWMEGPRLPRITSVDVPAVSASPVRVEVGIDDASELAYFVRGPDGAQSGKVDASGGRASFEVSGVDGARQLRLFAVSDQVQRPDYHQTAFMVSAETVPPAPERGSTVAFGSAPAFEVWHAAAAAAVAATALFIRRRLNSRGARARRP